MRPLARPLVAALAVLASALSLTAQEPPTPPPEPPPDQVVLKNGDRLTGVIKTMAAGKLTLTSPLLGDVVVEMSDVANLITGKPLALRTRAGETLQRRVTGIEGGALVLADPEAGGPGAVSLALGDLDQINPTPEGQWSGSVSLNFAMSDGNTDRRSVNASAEAERRTQDDRLTAKGAWDYGEDKTAGTWNLTQRRLGGELQYDYFLTEKVYALAQTAAQGDTLANLKLRFTAGAGLGYQWFEEPCFALSTEAGLSYFSESYRDNTPDSDTVAARLAYGVKWKITDEIELLQDVQAYPSLERASDVFVNADTRARMSLTESMFAQLQWVLNWDNTPATGRERLDNRYLVGVGWSF